MKKTMQDHVKNLHRQLKYAQWAIGLNFVAFFVSCMNFDFKQFPGYLFLSVTVCCFALAVILNDELNDQMERATKGVWYEGGYFG